MSSSRQSMRMTCQRDLGKQLFLGVAGLLGILFASAAFAAGFTTNFQPDATIWQGNNTGYCSYGACTSHIGNTDPTPMGETVVTIGGVNYFHTIVGDPATGFAIESYTRASGLNTGNNIPNSGGAFSPDGGGNERLFIGDNTTVATNLDFIQSKLNNTNPLAVNNQTGVTNYQDSGTGSVDPNFTVFRMVLTDTDPVTGATMSMEVYKPFLDKKPRISQTVQDGSLTSVFVADERALSYSDSSTPAPVTNNLVINDPNLPTSGAADFEMALAQIPDVTAGRFTFTRGTGWNSSAGWDSANSTFGQGVYQYVGGQGFNPLTVNWSAFFNYADNPGCDPTLFPATGNNNIARGGLTSSGTSAAGVYNVDALGNAVPGSCYNKP